MVEDDVTRADHACACAHCDPSLAVMTRRQGPQHVSVRFWDDPAERAQQSGAEVYVDGELVTGVFEAILGEQGTVWRYRGTPSGSSTGQHPCLNCIGKTAATFICTEKLSGVVELRAKARA
jgi:hypothetical protein